MRIFRSSDALVGPVDTATTWLEPVSDEEYAG